MTSGDLASVAAIYLATIFSPGPSTMAISATALARGRRMALALAAGVWCGSVFWSAMAAAGVSAVMAGSPALMAAMRYAGGAYLIWLGWRALRRAMAAEAPPPRAVTARDLRMAFLRGIALHLTNVKSVLFWGALFSLAVGPEASPLDLAEVVILCGALGAVIFPGYGVVFSTARAAAVYARARRWLEGAFG
ncbi:MAG: LysE family translocator, partial [Pseudomonadota bacterium]|nr:LysE family translocator [Pseudomonadota bacterium]